jgi:hypothetical protein
MRLQLRDRAVWLALDLLSLAVFVAYFGGGPSWLLPIAIALLIVAVAVAFVLTRRRQREF